MRAICLFASFYQWGLDVFEGSNVSGWEVLPQDGGVLQADTSSQIRIALALRPG
tara:strand:+ start:1999 stop:2160 length:162 start_codon:yes stop_codon:yes gene_type:complete